MFCWTEEGADNVAVFQTLITSCVLAGIDPYKYLVDVLQRISLHPARDIRELIPRLWKERFGGNPLKADSQKGSLPPFERLPCLIACFLGLHAEKPDQHLK